MTQGQVDSNTIFWWSQGSFFIIMTLD